MRSGTLSPALCVGLGEACKICADEIDEESKRITKLKTSFLRVFKVNVMIFLLMALKRIEFLEIST